MKVTNRSFWYPCIVLILHWNNELIELLLRTFQENTFDNGISCIIQPKNVISIWGIVPPHKTGFSCQLSAVTQAINSVEKGKGRLAQMFSGILDPYYQNSFRRGFIQSLDKGCT